jgi:RIO-like serine/threonine protein kinase
MLGLDFVVLGEPTQWVNHEKVLSTIQRLARMRKWVPSFGIIERRAPLPPKELARASSKLGRYMLRQRR